MPAPSPFLPAIPPAQSRCRWHVVFTNVRAERRAALCLRARGYTTFLPMRTRWVRQWRRTVEADTPLFPRYVFLGVRPGQSLWGLQHAAGVESVLRNGDTPLQAPCEAVDEIWRACATGQFDETRTPAHGPELRPGDAVEIERGMWATMPAIIAQVLSAQTVEVLIRMFGRETAVRVPVAALRRAC